jgi:TM2 domain-containing membrane protein YozV
MSRDLRRYARQTNFRLLMGTLLILFVVGLGLIYMFYGLGGLITGLLCMLGGLAPVVLIIAVLWIMDWVVRRANQD